MAKKNQSVDTNIVDDMNAQAVDGEAVSPVAPIFAPPKGFTKAGGDVAGYYNPAGDINFVPTRIIAVDNAQDTSKVSFLIIGHLTAPCMLDSDDGPIQANPGDLVGVWYKAGMAALKECAGAHVYMYPNGVKDTGKKNAMQVFEIFKNQPGKTLHVTDDKRKFSRNATMTFSSAAEQTERVSITLADNEIPF